MDITLREVGNSLVATIPKNIITESKVKKGDVCSIRIVNDGILIQPKTKKLKGEYFLEEYFGKPIKDIKGWDFENVPTGKPVGEEEW